MKIAYKKSRYKQWHLSRLKKEKDRKRKGKIKKKKKRRLNNNPEKRKKLTKTRKERVRRSLVRRNRIKAMVEAPEDLRLIENTKDCIRFFNKIRDIDNVSSKNKRLYVTISLKKVKQIDYGSICILTAIGDFLKFKKIGLKGDFPYSNNCANYLRESGFLSYMHDNKGNRFSSPTKSQLIFFKKSTGELSHNDNMKLTEQLREIAKYLTNRASNCTSVKTMILEICGNSIEWGKSEGEQWLLGVKLEIDRVIVTMTDLGRGILKTLYRKWGRSVFDQLLFKDDLSVLKGAFNQDYGSNTQELNRNKGLPSIREKCTNGVVSSLKILTNNVILHFDDEEKSKVIIDKNSQFQGTYYQWEMTKENIK